MKSGGGLPRCFNFPYLLSYFRFRLGVPQPGRYWLWGPNDTMEGSTTSLVSDQQMPITPTSLVGRREHVSRHCQMAPGEKNTDLGIAPLPHPRNPPPTSPSLPLLSLCLEHRTTGLRYGSLDIPLGLRQGELLFSGAGRKPSLFLVFPPSDLLESRREGTIASEVERRLGSSRR